MKDSELDPAYVEKREQLKELVGTIIRPKIVQGKTLSGKEFASFLEQVLLTEFYCNSLSLLLNFFIYYTIRLHLL